jgi:hypothetical protein
MMAKTSLRYVALSLFVLVLCCPACAHQLAAVNGGIYTDPKGYFELTLPTAGWQSLSWKGVDLVLWDRDSGATMVVDAAPVEKGANLINLSNHLLIAFERRQVISRNHELIQGREAVKTVAEAWVEGTAIKTEIYVVRGREVSYNIMFWAPRDVFPRQVGTFQQLLYSIHFQP